MSFQLPNLPYAYDALEPHIDARTMEIHHGKHHAGYVKGLNATEKALAEARGVRLKRHGADLIGLCPFHEEKTPSLNINQERQIYHCFGCGAGGDVIRFIELFDQVDFKTRFCQVEGRAHPPDAAAHNHDVPKITVREIFAKLGNLFVFHSSNPLG